MRGGAAIEEIDRFFAGTGRVHRTMRAVVRALTEKQLKYAVAGGMAMLAHGFLQTTGSLDVLVRAEEIEAVQSTLDGLGKLDAPVSLLVSQQYPGDGKPKPVAFPDPADVAVEIDGIKYVDLRSLIELKLASGISHPGRVKDLADVQDLIRNLKLPRNFGERLNVYVRGKFDELHQGVEPDQDSD